MKINYTTKDDKLNPFRKQNYEKWKKGHRVKIGCNVHVFDEGDLEQNGMNKEGIYTIKDILKTGNRNEGIFTIQLKGPENLFIAQSFINLDV